MLNWIKHKSIVENLRLYPDLSADEAKDQLVESLKDDAKVNAQSYISDIIEEAKQLRIRASV